MNIKQGAMFGLDARIALAIFGALSVISGAALYSAIQQSKTVANVVDLNEFKKAYEQYLLDTGEHLPVRTYPYLEIANLITEPSGVTGWNGPYIPHTTLFAADSNNGIHYPKHLALYYTLSKGPTWSSGFENCVVNDDECYVYVLFTNTSSDLTEAKLIDEYVDGEDNRNAGDIRYYDAFGMHVFNKGMKYPY